MQSMQYLHQNWQVPQLLLGELFHMQAPAVLFCHNNSIEWSRLEVYWRAAS